MGKRSDFPRRPMDAYNTPRAAVVPLVPFIEGLTYFAEPCDGDGDLVVALESFGLQCSYRGDIKRGQDALLIHDYGGCDAIITNPPWSRWLLHPMINHFQRIAPTWLLFDADWMHNRSSAPYLNRCSHIVSIGRVKWMPGSSNTGKDNAAWFRFDHRHSGGPKFYGRKPSPFKLTAPARQKVAYA